MSHNNLLFKLCILPAVVVLAIMIGKFTADMPKLAGILTVALLAGAVLLSRGLRASELSNTQRFYYLGFIICLILVWSPAKSLAYISPMIFTGLFIVLEIFDRDNNTFLKLLLIIFFWVLISCVYLVSYSSFSIQNSIICFFTYSSLIPLLVISNHKLAGGKLIIKICTFMIPVLWLECSVGILQGFYGIVSSGGMHGHFGDFVEGTIHLHPLPKKSLSNAMFSTNMTFGILGLLYLRKFKKSFFNDLLLALCFFTLCLASVIHLIAFFILALLAALVTANISTHKNKSRTIPSLVLIIFASIIFIGIAGKNITAIDKRIENIRFGQNYKTRAYTDYFSRAQKEKKLLFLGAGPGQYGSRAALISAGYLSFLPPGFSIQNSKYFDEMMFNNWISWLGQWWRSATNSPGSSIFALLSEFGLISFFLIFAGVQISRKFIKHSTDTLNTIIFLGGLFYIISIGLIDLYWEIPQAVFIGCLFLKVLYAQTTTKAST